MGAVPPEGYLTVPVVAERKRVPESQIYRAIYRGVLPYCRVGGMLFIEERAVLKWVPTRRLSRH